jgi:uncharacterized protein (TIGR02646 family)
MIRLPDVWLPADARLGLERLQSRIDSVVSYRERVAEAKRTFALNNRPGNATFRVVRSKLTEMCSGARRCCYCEDSAADEVEHIKPKDLYPQEVFLWENYLYACGPCNGPKNNQFAIFEYQTGTHVNISRKRGESIKAPVEGEAVLINPRREDPLAFMELDLIDTFYFLPAAEEGSKDHRRAAYTIEVLRLNDRDLLLEARAEAYGSYRARLYEYIKKRDSGASSDQLRNLISALRRMQHPTVWREIKRQSQSIAELRKLFAKAPEALEW